MKQITLFHPYVTDRARTYVQRVLSGKTIAQGPLVDRFESKFAEEFGFEPWQIVSLNSGTAALEIAYDLLKVGSEDEVITPVLTCTATNVPLARRNVRMVFADVQGKDHLNLDPEDVEGKITDRTKAIVFVHFGGSSAGLEEIEQLAEDRDLELVCDAAQALGSRLSKRARFSIISLQAIKSLTAGDGGILICRDKDDAELARKLRWFGYDRPLKQKLGDCDLDIAGYKYHMNDISAAIALGNLEHWREIKTHREAVNAVYRNVGANRGYVEGIWNPCVLDMDYETIRKDCQIRGVEIGQYHYRNDKYSVFRFAESDCPNMNAIEKKYFMLPCHMEMTLADARRVADIIWPTIKL